jgi:hypothetical protein
MDKKLVMNQLRLIEKHIGSTDIRDISKVLTAVFIIRRQVKSES